jgi:hypothetical protein
VSRVWVGLRWYGPSQARCYDLSAVRTEQTANGGSAMKLAILGIDLAKSVFHLYRADARGREVLRKR